MAKISGLGRGLNALLDESEQETRDNAPEAVRAGSELFVDPSLLKPNPHQPRREFDEEALKELADSIREH